MRQLHGSPVGETSGSRRKAFRTFSQVTRETTGSDIMLHKQLAPWYPARTYHGVVNLTAHIMRTYSIRKGSGALRALLLLHEKSAVLRVSVR